jgi:hypothetical protein
MISKAIQSLWPFGGGSNDGFDLADAINACERQLRSSAYDVQPEEQTPLFANLPSGDSTPERRLTGTFPDNPTTNYQTDEAPSCIEYSYKPLRLAVQLLYDFMLGLMINLIWLLDRWTRLLSVALPLGLYVTAFLLITRMFVYFYST